MVKQVRGLGNNPLKLSWEITAKRMRDCKAHPTPKKQRESNMFFSKIAAATAFATLLGSTAYAGCGLSSGNVNILGNEFGAIQALSLIHI